MENMHGKAALAALAGFITWRSLAPSARQIDLLFGDIVLEVAARRTFAEQARQEQARLSVAEITAAPDRENGQEIALSEQSTAVEHDPVETLMDELADLGAWGWESDAKWRDATQLSMVVQILGKRDRGKTSQGYRLVEPFRYTVSPNAVGAGSETRHLLPEWVGLMPALDELSQKSIAGVEGAVLQNHSQHSMADERAMRSHVVDLWRQRESFVRYAVVSELTTNLSLVTRRLKTTAFPRHKNMESVRRKYEELGPDAVIEPDIPSARLAISDQDRVRLALALFPSDPVASLSNEAIKQAINGGVFLTIDPATSELSETAMHKELIQAMKSVEHMRGFESSYGENLTRLFADLLPSSSYSGVPKSWSVRKRDLVASLRYYDWMDDLFNGHLAILNALIHGHPDPAPYKRSPVTPIGEIESARIVAERVSPTEITHLITNQIFPFGSRVMPEAWGSTEEAQIQNIAEVILKVLKAMNPEVEISPETLKATAREWLRSHTPSADEGLEEIKDTPS